MRSLRWAGPGAELSESEPMLRYVCLLPPRAHRAHPHPTHPGIITPAVPVRGLERMSHAVVANSSNLLQNFKSQRDRLPGPSERWQSHIGRHDCQKKGYAFILQ